MAKTLAEFRTHIQGLGYSTDTATQQTNAVNRAYRKVLSSGYWRFMEDTTTVSVAADTTVVALPISINQLRAVGMADASSNGIVLEAVTPEEILQLQNISPDSGMTSKYSLIGNSSIYLWPPPDATVTLKVYYVEAPTALAADSDTSLIPDPYDDLVVYAAAADLAMRERDINSATYYLNEYNSMLGTMRSQFGMRQHQTPTSVKQSPRQSRSYSDGRW